MFQLKEAGGATHRDHEESFIHRAIARWRAHPTVEVLGTRCRTTVIVSFVIRFGGRYLHHNYVVASLNDVFGIQARGGCSCAGPYGHDLLGIDLETSHKFEDEILHGCEGIKPGWVRVNFNYFISEEGVRVHRAGGRDDRRPWVDAAALLHLQPNQRSVASPRRAGEPALVSHDVDYASGTMTYPDTRHRADESSWGLSVRSRVNLRCRRSRPSRQVNTSTLVLASKTCAGSRCPKRSKRSERGVRCRPTEPSGTHGRLPASRIRPKRCAYT